jgi:hypothetical protein
MIEFTYEIIELEIGGKVLKRTSELNETAWIPIDEGNSDYVAYLGSLKPVEKPKSK